ncbi:hypothetical protein D1BOALGB6SA_5578 [Olavius sp. associated proteobacterium Delta 1]|nr:hypothetical protein D1BOALGB6SA_5578 [Olavius sp. associated proteobacterium Delta 1]
MQIHLSPTIRPQLNKTNLFTIKCNIRRLRKFLKSAIYIACLA